MKIITIFYLFIACINNMTIYSSEAIKAIDWSKERPEVPKGTDSQKERQEKALIAKRDELKRNIEEEKTGSLPDDPKIKLQQDILDYYEATLEQFNAEKRLEENPQDKEAQESKAIKEKERNDLNTKITQQIASTFSPASNNGQGEKQPAGAQRIIEKIKSAIKNLISKIVDIKFSNKATIEKVATSLKKSIADPKIANLPADFQTKPMMEKIELSLQAYDNPENSNIQSFYKQQIEEYVNALQNSDIEFSVQNKDPYAIAKHHSEIIKKLYDIGINQDQLDKLTLVKDNAINTIKETFKTPNAQENVKKFFTETKADSFNRSSFESKFDQLVPRKFLGEELNTFKKNFDELKTELSQLENYAHYSLDIVNTEYRSPLLEFLQKKYSELATIMQRVLNYNRKTEGIDQLVTDAMIQDLQAKAKQAETWLIENAASAEKRKPSTEAIKKIENENINAKPLDSQALIIANTKAPHYIDEFKAQLSKTNDPLEITLQEKFTKISEILADFITFSKDADPSKAGVDTAQLILENIQNLKNWIDLYATTFNLSEEQLKKLASYYSSLNELFAKISQQRNNDIQNIFRRLDDGSLILVDKSRRKVSGEVYVPIIFSIEKIQSLDEIITQFKAERKAMTTIKESGGL